MHPRVAILLPTYNGEKYLAEQLDSLIAQSYENLIIVIRDDGSSDGTLHTTHAYFEKFPDTFHLIENDGQNLGANGSFSFLTHYVLNHKKELGLEKAYMMFCDQDDIWAPHKVELELQGMEKAEAHNEGIPVLVHSDLKVISDSRKLIADSFMHYQGLHGTQNRFGQILFYNPVSGCTALINEPLAQLALPIPEEAVMHDWWIALTASAFGNIVYVCQPLVEYRQHSTNTLGALKKASNRSFRELVPTIQRLKSDTSLRDQALQANAFLQQYRDQLNMKQKNRIRLASLMRIHSGIVQKVIRRLGRRC